MQALSADEIVISLRGAITDARVSLFLDPTLFDPIREHEDFATEFEDAARLGAAQVVPLPHIHDNFAKSRHPYLIYISNEEKAERLLNASARLAAAETLGQLGSQHHARSVCGWITGYRQPQETARALSKAARVIKPNGQRWYLRYWDPRVLWHLPRVLPQAARARLAGQLGNWYFVSPETNQFCSAPSASPYSSDSDAAAPESLQFDDKTWNCLCRVGPVNAVIALAQSWGHTVSGALANDIDQSMLRCAQLGFPSDDDMITFAACALTSHARFDEHPEVRHRLDSSPSVAQAIGDFDEPFWQNLQRGDWLNTAQPSQG
jgi:Domain of unknown function (DUF4123)